MDNSTKGIIIGNACKLMKRIFTNNFCLRGCSEITLSNQGCDYTLCYKHEQKEFLSLDVPNVSILNLETVKSD